MRIGISGASGQLGQAVLGELVSRGSGDIVGISRTPATVIAPAEGRHGDYDWPDTLESAYADLDRLLIIPSPDVRAGIRDRHFRTAIDAAIRAGVRHLIMISSAAAREAPATEMYAPYHVGEQHLMRTASRWTILRMNYYSESFAQIAQMSLLKGMLTGLGENRVAFVSRDDLAAAAAGVLLSDGHGGAIYNITGPAAVTGDERAAILTEVSGKPIRYVMADETRFRSALVQSGMPEDYVRALIDIEKRFVAGDFDIVTGDVERLAGRPPLSLAAVLAKVLGANPNPR
jgi:NAD(P)H dehydrogenase (quinone)